MAASIKRLVPITRQQGVQVPGALQAAQWVDALVLVAATAKTYTLPVDGVGNKGRIFRVNAAAGAVWVNFAAVAAVPGADVTNGGAAILLRTDLGAIVFAVPDGTTAISFISTPGTTISIEAWN